MWSENLFEKSIDEVVLKPKTKKAKSPWLIGFIIVILVIIAWKLTGHEFFDLEKISEWIYSWKIWGEISKVSAYGFYSSQ